MYASAVEIAGFVDPTRLYSRAEVLARPSPVPAAGGVYGWWFGSLPPRVDASRCLQHDGLVLLYVGVSPRRPPGRGQQVNRQTLRTRLRTHYAGNAEGSTLRKTLGCLLSHELAIELRRVGSGQRRTFALGEQALSAWMGQHGGSTAVPVIILCDHRPGRSGHRPPLVRLAMAMNAAALWNPRARVVRAASCVFVPSARALLR